MRRAVASGIMAAETYLAARSSSFRAANLSRYRDLLSPIYDDVNRSGRDSFVSESAFVYHVLPRVLFSSSILSRTARIKVVRKDGVSSGDALKLVQARTSILDYDEDEDYSHIKVNAQLASKSVTKPWIPACPVNCYTLLTPKGVFASYKDLYESNLKAIAGDKATDAQKVEAFRITLKDVAEGELRFDHVACVACGTCGAIGPSEIVEFSHEREGHGVRYRFG